MANPTAAETRQLAAQGYAMPDGSYYIREGSVGVSDLDNAIKAVGRATPNAGESEVARRNAVRRHIMKRAKALNRTDMIPDTWNPDGSLKHSELVEDFLAHYGVVGMRWGHRKAASGDGSAPKQTRSERKSEKLTSRQHVHEQLAIEYAKRREDLGTHGVNSKTFKEAYGKDADLPDRNFAFKYGVTKMQAAAEGHQQLTAAVNHHARIAARAARKAEKIQVHHSALIDVNDEIFDPVAEDYFAHFGIHGMKWGVRKDRSSGSTHPDAARAHALLAQVQRSGGTHGLSNADLKTLNDRLSLESQHQRLAGSDHSEARKFVKDLLVNVAKQEGSKALTKGAEAGAVWVLKKYGKKK